MNTVTSRIPVAAGSASHTPRPAGFKVDISRGERVSRVSSEWFSRPDDERYLSLSDLYASVCARTEWATARTVESRAVRVESRRDDAEQLALIVPGRDRPVAPTHWSFGQLCSLVGAPAGYLRDLPAPLAAINLQHIHLRHIQPGKPQQNAYVERYNRTVRHEWLWTYNNERPNMGTGGMTPAQKLKRAA